MFALGKGAIYGTISAESHKDIIAKASKGDDGGVYSNNGQVVFEKLRKVEGSPTFVTLLIKINRPDAVLVLFEIGGHLNDVIVSPHVTEQADEATLVELDELFGQPNFVQILSSEKIIDEIVSRDSDDVFFNEGFAVDVEIDFVG